MGGVRSPVKEVGLVMCGMGGVGGGRSEESGEGGRTS